MWRCTQGVGGVDLVMMKIWVEMGVEMEMREASGTLLKTSLAQITEDEGRLAHAAKF